MFVLGEFVKMVKNFAEEYESRWKDATRFYTVNDMGSRFLIPDGRNALNSLTYTRVVLVYVDELSSKVGLNQLRKIALDMTEPAKEECEFNISQDVFIFLIRKMNGTFHSRRQGRDIFLFFNVVKIGSLNQIKFRIWKILGRLFIKRAEGIVKSCEDKMGHGPFGFLKSLVEFFMSIGEKMYKTAMENIKKVVRPIRKVARYINNNIAIRSAITQTNTSNNLGEDTNQTTSSTNLNQEYNSISNSNIYCIRNDEPDDDFDEDVDIILGDRPPSPDEDIPKRIKQSDIPIIA